MTQELIEHEKMQVLTLDEARRAYYKDQLAKFQKEGPKVIAAIKNKEGVEKATAWRIQVRDFIKSVEDGALGIASAWLHKRKKEIDAEIDFYTVPCDKMFKEAKQKMDRWYAEEAERIRIATAKANEKIIAKAEEKQAIQTQTLMDLGKPKQAMIAATRPVVAQTKPVEMPKIKGAVWKKKYVVQIDDVGALLAYLAKKPQYYRLIDQEVLRSRLEGLAADLAGNMQEFKGIRCFETANSAVVGGPK